TFEQGLASYDAIARDERAVITYLVGELWRRAGDAARAAAGRLSEQAKEQLRGRLRTLIAAQPGFLRQLDRDGDRRVDRHEMDAAVDAALAWAERTRDTAATWYYAEAGETAGPAPWRRIRELARRQPALPVNLDGAPLWLPYEVVAAAEAGEKARPS
ncbi:MAG TPA: hypothetical protein VHM02_00320, partial [Thermoanaerobaculia bacterium]|nr:hypothetical protein [Thermoanaerobaculia bacterium]